MRDQSVNQNTGSWSTSESATTQSTPLCNSGVYTDYVGAGHATDVTASASSLDAGSSAANTINGAGLTGNEHDALWDSNWTSDGDGGNPPAPSPNPARGSGQWIYWDLGHSYPLGLMHVWNGNEAIWGTAYGLNSVTIDYSEDGTNWIESGTFWRSLCPLCLDNHQ
jgi:hypothetical protein